MTPPLLSIVIPSHRRTDLLALCLRSILISRTVRVQIIVVDDGSKGASVSEVARQFDGVEIVRHNRPRGFAVAANAGIARATAEVVELLNDDAEVTHGWETASLERFRNPAIVAVAPLVLIHPATTRSREPIIDSFGDEYDPGGFARKRGHGERLRQDHLVSRSVWGVSAAAGFYRRQELIRLGGFAE